MVPGEALKRNNHQYYVDDDDAVASRVEVINENSGNDESKKQDTVNYEDTFSTLTLLKDGQPVIDHKKSLKDITSRTIDGSNNFGDSASDYHNDEESGKARREPQGNEHSQHQFTNSNDYANDYSHGSNVQAQGHIR